MSRHRRRYSQLKRQRRLQEQAKAATPLPSTKRQKRGKTDVEDMKDFLAFVRNTPFAELEKFRRKCPAGWKQIEVDRRINEIKNARKEFEHKTETMSVGALRNLINSPVPEWQKDKARRSLYLKESKLHEKKRPSQPKKFLITSEQKQKQQRVTFWNSMNGMDVTALKKVLTVTDVEWMRAEVCKRLNSEQRNEHKKEVAQFRSSLRGKNIQTLSSLALSATDVWKRQEIEMRIEELQESHRATQLRRRITETAEFAASLKDKSTETLSKMLSACRADWKREEIEKRIKVLHRAIERRRLAKEVKEFILSLKGKSTKILSKMLTSCSVGWKRSEIEKRIEEISDRKREIEDRRHEKEISVYASSLKGKSISLLSKMLLSCRVDWKRQEIQTRIAEINDQKRAEEDAQFHKDLRSASPNELCKLASSFLGGVRNQMICNRILESLPTLDMKILQEIAASENPGLRHIVAKVRLELASRRKMQASDFVPRFAKYWT